MKTPLPFPRAPIREARMSDHEHEALHLQQQHLSLDDKPALNPNSAVIGAVRLSARAGAVAVVVSGSALANAA